jgi:hypothetical protein
MKKKIIVVQCLVFIAYWRRVTSVRQYIGGPMPPVPLYYWRTEGFTHRVLCRFTSPTGGQNKKNETKEADQTVRSASPIFKTIAY